MPPRSSSIQRRPRDAAETSPASNVERSHHLSLQQLSSMHESSRHVSNPILALSTMLCLSSPSKRPGAKVGRDEHARIEGEGGREGGREGGMDVERQR
jgi:hypothetical protein